MFGNLPGLLGRDFLMGFLVPSALFLLGNAVVFFSRQLSAEDWLTAEDPLARAALGVVVAWLLGLFLLGVHGSVIRFKEGYLPFNPARLLAFMERRRFRRMRNEIDRLDELRDEMQQLGKPVPPELEYQRTQLYARAADRFPDSEAYLLPTPFGNTIRAFERYPEVIYGAESIYVWDRLMVAMPADVRGVVESAKSQMSFWLNLWLLGWMLALEMLVMPGATDLPWPLAIALFVVLGAQFASWRARGAAQAWGASVKACFDVYLPVLRKRLELVPPRDRDEERQQWDAVSLALGFRLGEHMPPLSSAPEPEPAARPPAPGSGM